MTRKSARRLHFPWNRAVQPGALPLLSATVAGGILWAVFGFFRFETPLGPDVAWREDLGYSLILSVELFRLYNLPGVLALLLTSWSALCILHAVRTSRPRLKRAAKVTALLALLLGVVAATGQAVLFDPLTTGGLSFGAPVLGLSIFLAGLAAVGHGTNAAANPGLRASALMLLGIVGMLTLPLRPLMYALSLLPLVFGTAVFALFGAGWAVQGFWLGKQRRPAGEGKDPDDGDSPDAGQGFDPSTGIAGRPPRRT